MEKEVEVKMATQVGKRYVCKKCGAEFIVTRAGKGELYCCGEPMELKASGGEKKK
jgi:desulfoferrodoxin-like iron-binding protein